MIYTDAHEVAAILLGAVEGVMDNDETEPIVTAYVALGSPAFDNCCGQVVVIPERVWRSVTFPDEWTGSFGDFASLLVTQMLIIVTRCVPVGNGRSGPDQDAVDRKHAQLLGEVARIWRMLECDLPDDEWQVGSITQEVIDTGSGGCIAVAIRVVIGLDQETWGI